MGKLLHGYVYCYIFSSFSVLLSLKIDERCEMRDSLGICQAISN